MVYKLNLKAKCLILITLIAILSIITYSVFASKSHTVSSSASVKNGNPVFIIDPGHGGEDGGTSAKDGTVEKGINLSIALKLKDLMQFAGYDVIMTREKDTLIYDSNAKTIRQKKVSDIRNRMKMINDNPNSILISIHQNYFENPVYNGAQVFYSKNNPKSKVLAEEIQHCISSKLQKDNKRIVKKTGTEIYLLYHAKTPAVMVECGFLSNIDETEKLKDEEYQKKIALSIFGGILNYLENSNENEGESKYGG